MRRADRLLHLIQILRRHRRPVTGERIAEELEVSLRTVYRDISALILQGVPIRGEAGIGYVLGEGFDLPPLMFNADELDALMLGLRWVARYGDETLSRAAHDSVAKIATVLPATLKPYLYDSSLLVPPPYFEELRIRDESQFRRAIREERKISLRYNDLSDAMTERIVWPIALTYYGPKRLLVGWCELRADFRSFRTDRILELSVLDERYPKRRRVLLSQWQKQEAAQAASQATVDSLA
jgi:predicted DNA-binding transcriptional regulator YafY